MTVVLEANDPGLTSYSVQLLRASIGVIEEANGARKLQWGRD